MFFCYVYTACQKYLAYVSSLLHLRMYKFNECQSPQELSSAVSTSTCTTEGNHFGHLAMTKVYVQ